MRTVRGAVRVRAVDRLRVATLGLVVISTVLTGCATRSMSFSTDDRLAITSPKDLAVFDAPPKVKWRTSGLPSRQQVAVFLDTRPIQPGQSLRALADEACKRTPGCPDKAYFARHGVYLTRSHSASFPVFPIKGMSARREDRHTHQAIVVLIDERGRRDGESAWSVMFRAAS